ncbi:MAG: hypothetical protein IIW52_05345 [Alistipes sp.]|nr:hypothetical protein [Alistipes sp.]
MKQIVYILSALAVGLFIGVFIGNIQRADMSTRTTVDTVIYYRPMPIKSTMAKVRTIYIPRLLFAPTDTVQTTTVIIKGDSLQLQVPIERREYRDSSYYAVVSGAVVGDIHPELVSLETYAKNTMQVLGYKPPMFRFYISGAFGKDALGAGAGVLIKNRYGIGADYNFINGKSCIMARGTFYIN